MSALDSCPKCGAQDYSIFAGAWTDCLRELNEQLPEGWTACLAMTEEDVLGWAAAAPGYFFVRQNQADVVRLAHETLEPYAW